MSWKITRRGKAGYPYCAVCEVYLSDGELFFLLGRRMHIGRLGGVTLCGRKTKDSVGLEAWGRAREHLCAVCYAKAGE